MCFGVCLGVCLGEGVPLLSDSASLQDGQVSVEEFKCAIKDTCLNKEYDELPDALRAFIGSLFATVDVNGMLRPISGGGGTSTDVATWSGGMRGHEGRQSSTPSVEK